jgi:hypothetical protein
MLAGIVAAEWGVGRRPRTPLVVRYLAISLRVEFCRHE